MNFIETVGLVLLLVVGLLVVVGVVRSRFTSSKKVIPPPRFDIGTLVHATSTTSSPYKARIATRNWHYAEQSYFYVLEGKSKIYLENELDVVLEDSTEGKDDSKPRGTPIDTQTATQELQPESLGTPLLKNEKPKELSDWAMKMLLKETASK